MACVQVPALPLQVLLQAHPDWKGRPCAVVSEDKPEGKVQWVNSAARKARVLSGLRFITALGLAPDLRAGAVSQARVDKKVEGLAALLMDFSPVVEPYPDVPGCFWLDASGLSRLYPSLTDWAQAIRAALEQAGFYARVAVAYSRFGAYAAASVCRGVEIFASPGDERAAIRRVPLARLEVAPGLREALDRLGVRDVGALLKLPAGGLRARFGAELWRLHCLAAGESGPPLAPLRPPVDDSEQLFFDFPEGDAHRLLFFAKRLLHPLLNTLAGRGEALRSLGVKLLLDGRDGRRQLDETLQPAEPTLDETQLLDLLRLLLERLFAPSAAGRAPGFGGAIEMELQAQGVCATKAQLRLFAEQPRRDLAAADRALARLRAELGEQAVVCAQLREAHLPEARFVWKPVDKLPQARPSARAEPALLRRIYARPTPLPPRLRLVPEGWMLGKHEHGAVEKLHGPYIVSGGWWAKEVRREYHFAETQRGQLLWIYNDRRRRRWYIQGEVL